MSSVLAVFPGQLCPSFSVQCGKCKWECVATIGDARTPTEARRELKEMGWEMSRAWGLICPKCVSGTEGGTKEEPKRTYSWCDNGHQSGQRGCALCEVLL